MFGILVVSYFTRVNVDPFKIEVNVSNTKKLKKFVASCSNLSVSQLPDRCFLCTESAKIHRDCQTLSCVVIVVYEYLCILSTVPLSAIEQRTVTV